jgi:hypothetical protein
VTTLLAAALDASSRLGPVFPTRPDKRPLTLHGFHDATDDRALSEEWFGRRWPWANLAVAVPSSVFVVDVDAAPGGFDTLARLEDRHGALPATCLVRGAAVAGTSGLPARRMYAKVSIGCRCEVQTTRRRLPVAVASAYDRVGNRQYNEGRFDGRGVRLVTPQVQPARD